VLSALLAEGKTSRLYRLLTDTGLTTDTSASAGFHHDPSLHLFTAELTTGTKHAAVEKQIFAELERIKKDGVSAAEVQTAIAQLLATAAFARDGSFAVAEQLNEYIAVGDWTLYLKIDELLRAVTPADVQRVAVKYFHEDQSTVGWFVPVEAADAGDSAAADELPPLKAVVPPKAPEGGLPPVPATEFAKRVIREKISGADVLLCRTGVKDVVTIHGSLPAGDSAAPAANRALARLTAEMLDKGTLKRDQFVIADLLEKVGATLEFDAGTDTVEFKAKCLSKDAPLVIELLAEQFRQPAMLPAELAKLKKQIASEAQQSLEDTDKQAEIAFTQAVFPEGHPNRLMSVPEFTAAVQRAKIDEVRKFHAAHYGPAGLHCVVVGDFDPAVVRAAVEKAFAGWSGGREAAEVVPPAARGTGAEKLVSIPGKTSVSVAFGLPSGLRANEPDYLPLNVATAVLGRGFTSRLVGNVRDREGLTYGIGAKLTGDSFHDGAWLVRATFSPALLERGVASTQREIQSWLAEGITADELDYRKSAIAGEFAVSLETSEGLATQLLSCVERGFPVSWLDEFPARIAALTLEQVNGVLRKRIDPAAIVTIKAGTLAK
jgi:zinc protease